MKSLCYVAMLWVLATGCRSYTNISPETLIEGPALQNAACITGTPIVKRVTDRVGTVGRNPVTNVYVIRYAVPGTIDSQETGVVCNLPDALKDVGRSVTFDGEYRTYDQTPTGITGGEIYYYLTLTKVSYVP